MYCILSLPSLLARVDQDSQFGRSLTVYQDGAQCGPQNPYCNVSHYNVNEKMLFYKKIRLLCIFFPGNIFGGNSFWSKLEKKKTLIWIYFICNLKKYWSTVWINTNTTLYFGCIVMKKPTKGLIASTIYFKSHCFVPESRQCACKGS